MISYNGNSTFIVKVVMFRHLIHCSTHVCILILVSYNKFKERSTSLLFVILAQKHPFI